MVVVMLEWGSSGDRSGSDVDKETSTHCVVWLTPWVMTVVVRV